MSTASGTTIICIVRPVGYICISCLYFASGRTRMCTSCVRWDAWDACVCLVSGPAGRERILHVFCVRLDSCVYILRPVYAWDACVFLASVRA